MKLLKFLQWEVAVIVRCDKATDLGRFSEDYFWEKVLLRKQHLVHFSCLCAEPVLINGDLRVDFVFFADDPESYFYHSEDPISFATSIVLESVQEAVLIEVSVRAMKEPIRALSGVYGSFSTDTDGALSRLARLHDGNPTCRNTGFEPISTTVLQSLRAKAGEKEGFTVGQVAEEISRMLGSELAIRMRADIRSVIGRSAFIDVALRFHDDDFEVET